ncbi:MAG: hypothetical protein AAF394_17300, partial [Planctomycetota bacterium]
FQIWPSEVGYLRRATTSVRVFLLVAFFSLLSDSTFGEERFNILSCLSDDQSYAHTSANGDPVVQTPVFDRIAREGLRFTHALFDAPSCIP